MNGNWVFKSANSLLVDTLLSIGHLYALSLCKHCLFVFSPFWELWHSDITWLFLPFLLFIGCVFLVQALSAAMFMLDYMDKVWLVSVQEMGTSGSKKYQNHSAQPFPRAGTQPCNQQLTQKDEWNIFFTQVKGSFHHHIANYNSKRPSTETIMCPRDRESTRDCRCHQGLWNIRGFIRTMPR